MGTLAILDRLDLVDSDTLCWWLCERQLPNGGLNGRPEKLEDVSFRDSCPILARLERLLIGKIMKNTGLLLVVGCRNSRDIGKIALDRWN